MKLCTMYNKCTTNKFTKKNTIPAQTEKKGIHLFTNSHQDYQNQNFIIAK